jgi:diguanylate cyclase (GGDEF)-like protein
MYKNFEKIYQRIAEIVVEYESHLNSINEKLTYQGFKDFLKNDTDFSEILTDCLKSNVDNISESILSQLNVLEIYLGKEKVKNYELKVKQTKELTDLTDTISLILYDLYVNFDSVNHSFLKLVKFLNSLNSKVVKSHNNMISTVDDSIKNLKEEHFTGTKIINDVQDINKMISSNSNSEIIGESVMKKVDDIIHLVEKNIENKIKQIEKYEKVLQNLKTDIAIYERQTKILEAEIKKAKKETITDEKTGLYSYKMIPLRLSEENEKYLRKNIPYSVMILRIQNIEFGDKKYLDYIHEFVMIHLAELIKNSIRKVDIPFVYKDDGILVIMPETTSESCKNVVNRIMENVKKTLFNYQENKIKISVGASCIMKDEELNTDDILSIINKKYEQILKVEYFNIID